MASSAETESGISPEGWELTGNHYVAAPAISVRDGSLHALNVLHRGFGGLVSWAGQSESSASSDPLFRLRFAADGPARAPTDLRWERIDRWIPRWRARLAGELTAVGTICFPGGLDAAIRGGVLSIELHNGGRSDIDVDVVLECRWRRALLTVATTRPLAGPNRLVRGTISNGVALEAGHGGQAPAIAVAG
ncbi:MAG: hypothetical protein ACREMQ_12740, partial [Longimicrobiales bacterium]